eukprot:scaffold5569_cov116-Isochrysis_galbana.AAC.4
MVLHARGVNGGRDVNGGFRLHRRRPRSGLLGRARTAALARRAHTVGMPASPRPIPARNRPPWPRRASIHAVPPPPCLAQLNDDLTDLTKIMTQNIQDVLGRGEMIDCARRARSTARAPHAHAHRPLPVGSA